MRLQRKKILENTTPIPYLNFLTISKRRQRLPDRSHILAPSAGPSASALEDFFLFDFSLSFFPSACSHFVLSVFLPLILWPTYCLNSFFFGVADDIFQSSTAASVWGLNRKPCDAQSVSERATGKGKVGR